jgi:hypothetical protein
VITARFPFRLRGADGSVVVEFRANEDPQRWGYGALGAGVADRARPGAAGAHGADSTRAGRTPELREPTLLDAAAWIEALPLLRETFAEWRFLDAAPS